MIIVRKSTFSTQDTNLIKTSSIKMRQGKRLRNNENWDINISLWIFYIFMSYKMDDNVVILLWMLFLGLKHICNSRNKYFKHISFSVDNMSLN